MSDCDSNCNDREDINYWRIQGFILSLRLGFVVPREFFCPSGLFELTSRRWLVGQKNSQTKPNFRDRILFMIHGIRGRVLWPGQNASGKSYLVADYSPLENFAFCNYCALKHFFDYSKKISCCQNSAKRFIRKQTLLSVPEDQRTNDISTLKMTQGLIFCKIFKLKA